MDPRYAQLADQLVQYSVSLQAGQKVLIEAFDIPDRMVHALVRSVRAQGGVPFVSLHHSTVSREMLMGATEEQYEFIAEIEMKRMQGMDAYIALRGADNIFEMSDVPSDRMKLALNKMRPVLNHRVNHTKWVVLRWPTAGMAQQALTSTESFEDFYFRVCTLDYSRMIPGQNALKARMDAAKLVEIKGNGTDLRFSIDGLQALTCVGTHNIPDGEVFTSPVKDSVEGVIQYNAPTVYQGVSFDNVRLVFEKGRIVEATCAGNQAKLLDIFNSDEGARYIGEFALGCNPHILEPMRDILFDEKIAGSFHFTPGQAYEGVADNGNRSQVHWDLVCIQRPEYGGGEIYFDGELIRKDGLFVPDDLRSLNPEQLLAE
ncbi:MAG: aminopeptidase [Verrucomicrobiota bacterium JB022]|nr:aminopeptidase [Verrucomicrobiota bacterium JB022]